MKKKLFAVIALLLCMAFAVSILKTSFTTPEPPQQQQQEAADMIQPTETPTTQPEAFWQDVFTVPSQAQVAAYTNTSGNRGPYVYGWTDIARTDRFCEYAVV